VGVIALRTMRPEMGEEAVSLDVKIENESMGYEG
jgi:hypothetical protein